MHASNSMHASLNIPTLYPFLSLIYYRCERSVLTNCYPSSELMPYQGTANFKYTQESPTVTLREAVMTRKGGTKCNCIGSCKSGRCSCRHIGFECSCHCHPKNSSCLNKDSSEDNDGTCTISRVESSSNVSSLSKRQKNQVELHKRKRRKGDMSEVAYISPTCPPDPTNECAVT